MKKYEVIKLFTDLKDNSHVYRAGDIFPRDKVEVSDERIRQLASGDNRRGVPLIREIVEKHETADGDNAQSAPNDDAQPKRKTESDGRGDASAGPDEKPKRGRRRKKT